MALMNVLVADDEERVCALICALIDWEGLGLTLVGTAYDGINALQLIEQKHPDLVITDIRMPGLDGLELIQRAKALDDHIQFIIISGHRQFDYAQSAIKFGVAEYLLKPIKQVELQQTLLRMKENHSQELEKKEQSQALQKQVKLDREHLKKTSFTSFLVSQDERILSPWYEEHSKMQIGIVGIQGHAKAQVSLLISKKIEQLFSNTREAPCLCCWKNDVYLLWMYPKQVDSPSVACTPILLDLLKTQTQIFGELHSTLALGVEVEDLQNLILSYRSAKQVLANRLIDTHGTFFQSNQVEKDESAMYVHGMDESFALCCAQDSEEITLICQTLFNEFEQSKQRIDTILDTCILSVDHAVAFVNDHAQTKLVVDDYLSAIEQAQSLDVLKSQFYTTMQTLFSLYKQSRESVMAKPIRIAQAYLAQHYQDEQLNLEAVSEIVNLNSSYFSALFKKSVGQGFAEYVLELRIKKAKELLVETNLGIARIALQVGYHDPKHFTKIFKKTCQIKPIEYRKLYG